MMKFLLVLCFFSSAFAQVENPDLPSPEVLTKKYLDELSGRKVGQTKFVLKSSNEQYQEEQAGANREIQESDIFKLGNPGKKEVFLLNNHRGFQVVSFQDGLEKPKLVGRLPLYNNWSSEMYYLPARDQVLILNTEWSYTENDWRVNYNTRVYLVDVSDSSSPKVLKKLVVPGYLQKSRLVGDVLYTITNSGSWRESRAAITSLRVSKDSLTQVEEVELHGEKRFVKTMNVLKEEQNYYVIATLSNWRMDGDFVEVHDITSSKGKINKVLTAKARGTVTEQSGTFFHKGHLFAVSQYRLDTAPSRISVEAYPLTRSEVVQTSQENMRLSIGDTNGQHASLQDVRVSGDLLYAFWVPRNQIDPFDLIDISEPSKGLKHLGQLQFEGWIEKAIPLDVNNRRFVLGLGWVTPVTSENGRRYPQAKLFEIKKTDSGYKHEVISSLALDQEDFWATLNGADKNFEVIEESSGVFNILFPVTFRKNYVDGGKVVVADLNSSSLREGASLMAQGSWLRRVFANRELSTIHTFSDKSLETFNQSDLSTSGLARSVSALELARDIIDFHVLSQGRGIQIVRQDDSVELRKVELSHSDAEISEIMGLSKIAGEYAWHKIQDGKLQVITKFYKPLATSRWSRKFDYANFNIYDFASGSLTSTRIDLNLTSTDEYFYFDVFHISTGTHEVFTISNQMFVLNVDKLDSLTVATECQYFFDPKSYNLSVLNLGEEVVAFNSFVVEPVDGDEDDEFSYSLSFIKPLTISQNTVSCSPSINTPGVPILKKGGFLVSSEVHYDSGYEFDYDQESSLKGINFKFASEWENPGSMTFSLKLKSDHEMVLVDILNKDITAGMHGNGFITYTKKESRIDLWSLSESGEFFSRPQYLNFESDHTSLISMKNFFGRSFLFMKNRNKVELFEIINGKTLLKRNVTSTFDDRVEDGSAEYIFDIKQISSSQELSRFYISGGFSGLNEIIVQ